MKRKTVTAHSESQIEQRHRDIARKAGWRVYKIMRSSPNGLPDRLYCRNRRFVLMEWKKPNGVLSAQQKLRHKELREAGIEVYVVDNVGDANRILQLEDSGRAAPDQSTLGL
jgi:hypothetical protein